MEKDGWRILPDFTVIWPLFRSRSDIKDISGHAHEAVKLCTAGAQSANVRFLTIPLIHDVPLKGKKCKKNQSHQIHFME
jgi:hypothetical protein